MRSSPRANGRAGAPASMPRELIYRSSHDLHCGLWHQGRKRLWPRRSRRSTACWHRRFAHHGSSHRSLRCLVQGMFGNPQECRERAKECLERARSAPTLLVMTKLESLAHLWLRLADELESLEAVLRRLKKPERKTSWRVQEARPIVAGFSQRCGARRFSRSTAVQEVG